ncbi:MAG: hypothetical protein MI757_05395 [Pirellulales bacterium]|nr:hypothetical protein [Pirellulales bacterium]
MTMLDPSHPIAQLLSEDRRYKLEAYAFVFEALTYAQNELGMGKPQTEESGEESDAGEDDERHLTGQQLCEAIRCYALEQYGYMAKCVLNSWGVTETRDFGEIVFNLIRIGQMRKRAEDKIEDFDDVFDFDRDLQGAFEITMPSSE